MGSVPAAEMARSVIGGEAPGRDFGTWKSPPEQPGLACHTDDEWSMAISGLARRVQPLFQVASRGVESASFRTADLVVYLHAVKVVGCSRIDLRNVWGLCTSPLRAPADVGSCETLSASFGILLSASTPCFPQCGYIHTIPLSSQAPLCGNDRAPLSEPPISSRRPGESLGKVKQLYG